MGDNFFTRDKFRRPEILFKDILRKGAQGLYKEKDDFTPFLYRALVVAVDVEGGKLENEQGSGSVQHTIAGKSYTVNARLGPKNPVNSVKARILTEGRDKFFSDEDLRVFWPFFPENISLPIKPGEHVYVMFEDSNMLHGLWFAKIPGHIGVNYAPGQKFYRGSDSNSLASNFDDTRNLVGIGEKKYDNDDDAAETTSGERISSLFGK